MALDSDHPALVRLRAWCAARSIGHKGSLMSKGNGWRAELTFSDDPVRIAASGKTPEAAIARVVESAIGFREQHERMRDGAINTFGTLSGRGTPVNPPKTDAPA